MQFKQSLVRLIFLLLPFSAFSQTTYLPQDARENILLERLEIKAQTDSVLNFSKIKPFSRKQFIPVIQNYYLKNNLSGVDVFNAQEALMKNTEWVDSSLRFKSKKTFLKSFYKSPANFYEVYTKDFTFILNPVFQYYIGKESNNRERLFLNARGISLRGNIAHKIGFDVYITDNQERDPLYVQQLSLQHRFVPGEGFYKPFKNTGYDYFDGRGSITFNATKFIDVQFGYDKNFIGNGYRSLFLSDYSSPYLFLKLNTRVWKFNYENLFMELNASQRLRADTLFPKKYAVMHHLDIAITKWLNVGAFEAIIFGRPNRFEFGYLNPVIFYRSIELQNGSPDNALVGFDAKANVAKKFQFYGQLLLDEFVLSEIKKNRGFWGNKFGFQLGAKYIDAFNVKNLDLQIETNRVRPFTYSYSDSVSDYTHYNQPLAHPLGANFQEWIGIARYQPAAKWLLQAKVIYYMQGKDTGNVSFGGNIFLPYLPPYRTQEFGYSVGAGIRSKTGYASLLASYEWKPNLFIELNAVIRKESATTISPSKNSALVYLGVRWNMWRREFDY